MSELRVLAKNRDLFISKLNIQRKVGSAGPGYRPYLHASSDFLHSGDIKHEAESFRIFFLPDILRPANYNASTSN